MTSVAAWFRVRFGSHAMTTQEWLMMRLWAAIFMGVASGVAVVFVLAMGNELANVVTVCGPNGCDAVEGLWHRK